MARYDYVCDCAEEIEVTHGMNETPEILCTCGKIMRKAVPRNINFVLKGMSWTGKNIKEKSYREKRRQQVGKKMAQSHDIPQILPNYKGEVCKSWDEAKTLAKQDGIDPLKYESQVKSLQSSEHKAKEKREKLIRGEG